METEIGSQQISTRVSKRKPKQEAQRRGKPSQRRWVSRFSVYSSSGYMDVDTCTDQIWYSDLQLDSDFCFLNERYNSMRRREGQNVDDRIETVYRIPKEIPDAKLEEYFLEMKSKLEKYCYTTTMNRAERTITFSQEVTKLNPGPAFNKYGKLRLISFTVSFPEKRATKLKDFWPDLESLLNNYNISCKLNLAECSVAVSTSISLEDPDIIFRARNLLELLSTSLVPPYMALEIFKGIRQHETISIGDQQGGLCSNFGIKKEEYHKRWDCLFCSVKALSKATHCHIFLSENSFTAVTAESTDKRISWLRAVVEDCITKNLCPAIHIRKFEKEFGMHQSMDDLEDPHAKHMEMVKSGPSLNKDGMLEVCSLYTLVHRKRAKQLKKDWPMLESFLSDYGLSCTLAEDSMAFSTTRITNKPDIIDKAWQLLELLSTTYVPASLAIEIMDGSTQTCLIKIGNQEGGICSEYGIKEEEYLKRRECLCYSIQALAETADCTIFLNDNTIAALGNTSVGLIKQYVENCILHDLCPGTACMVYNSMSRGLQNIEDPHFVHMEMKKSGSSLGMLNVASFITSFEARQAIRLKNDWPIVELCLKEHAISCKLVLDEFYMTASITGRDEDFNNSDIMDKILDFLKLLSVNVPPSKAIKVLKGGHLYYDFIPAGYEYGGGFCSKFGITKEQFDKEVWPRVERGVEERAKFMDCDVVISPNVITVWGAHKQIGELARFVQQCFDLKGRPTATLRSSRRKPVHRWS